jgi:hypothetical protein
LNAFPISSRGERRWEDYRNALENSYPPGQSIGALDHLPYDHVYRHDDVQLVDIAISNPEVQQRLLRLAEHLGPGAQDSWALHLLTQFYLRKGEPQKVVQLLQDHFEGERLFELEDTSADLATYLQACYASKDFARIEKILDALAGRFPQRSRFIALQRLMLLRHQGREEAADALEEELIAAARQPSPGNWKPGPTTVELMNALRTRHYYGPYGDSYVELDENANTVVALAALTGVSLDPAVHPLDVNLVDIRSAYTRHTFYGQVAKIADLELAAMPELASDNDRFELILSKVHLLGLAGAGEEAKRLMTTVEQHLSAMVGPTPARAGALGRVAGLYASPPFGPDYQRALDSHFAARTLNPGIDPFRLTEAYYLCQLNRYNTRRGRSMRMRFAGAIYGGMGARGRCTVPEWRPIMPNRHSKRSGCCVKQCGGHRTTRGLPRRRS